MKRDSLEGSAHTPMYNLNILTPFKTANFYNNDGNLMGISAFAIKIESSH